MFDAIGGAHERLRPYARWLGVAAIGVIGCREYTCFDTASCSYPVDAGASTESSDAGSKPGLDATTPVSSDDSTVARDSEQSATDTSETRTLTEANTSLPPTVDDSSTTEGPQTNDVPPTKDGSATDDSSINGEPSTNEQVADSSATAPDHDTSVGATSGSSHSSAPLSSTTSANSSYGAETSSLDPSSDTQSQQTGGRAPSEGCGKASPNTGSSGSPLNVSGHNYYVKLPQGYDPNTPYPVVIMFNPTGNPISWAETAAGFESAAAEWIRVYPHMANQNAGWGVNDLSFFAPFHERITSSYCVDTSRVFAAGESSGGDFVGILGCEHADKLRGVAPCATKAVAGYPLDAGSRTCTGQVTSVVIHGKNDSVVGTTNGPLLRDFYKSLNHCDATTLPVDGYTDALSNCVKYEGCDEGFDTYWCSHEDPNYANTNHGWPAFAAAMLVETWSRP